MTATPEIAAPANAVPESATPGPAAPASAATGPSPRRLSEVLRALEPGQGDRITLAELIAALGDRSFAPLLVLLALPNLVLYLPGSSALTGLPLMLLSLQLLAGRRMVWLPNGLAVRSVDRAGFLRIIGHALPWIERVERLARPRLWPRSDSGGANGVIDRAIGLACLVLAVLLFLPIPFANGVPALAIIALGLALSERDGLWLLGGMVAAGLAVLFVIAILAGGAAAVMALLG